MKFFHSFFLLFAFTSSAFSSVVIFDGTGADLVNDSRTITPTRTASVSGSNMVFSSSSSNLDMLVVLPLFPAATFDPLTGEVQLTIDLTITRNTVDFDPVIGISDGINFVGGYLVDNGNGSGGILSGTSNNTSYVISSSSELFTNEPFGGAFSVLLTISLTATQSGATVELGGSSEAGSLMALDRTQALSLFIGLGNGPEDMAINSLTVLSNVPEPSTTALLVGGVVVACARFRRKGK